MAKESRDTSGGVELTDALIDKLAEDAERGYDDSRLTRRRGRPPLGTAAARVFQVRLEPGLREVLEALADSEQTTASDVARRALQTYLDAASSDERARPVGKLISLPTRADASSPWNTDGPAWTAARRDIIHWLKTIAAPLAPMYAAAVVMVDDEDFPGRVPLIAHTVREIRNRLPEFAAGPIELSRANYTPLVDRVLEQWTAEGFDDADAFGSHAALEPSDLGPRYLISRPLMLAIANLLHGHAAGTARNRETAQALFETVTGGRPPSYVVNAWLSATRWAQAYAHIRLKPLTLDDEKGATTEFERLEQDLVTLTRRSNKNMDELDAILAAANT